MYGPTENTTFSTFFPVDKNYETNIPIGKPIGNSTVYIVDKYNNLQPVGITGELCTGGDGTARGYLNRVELTDEKFVSHPFIPGERLYKTGDFALWLPDGNIEFLGRRDNQVKIRGFRIELGEIENLLLTHKDIEECFVTSREMNGENQVIAYYKKKNKIRLWPSLAEYFVYDDLIYQSMVNDESRNEKYANAIKKAVKDKVVLEIGPGGEAILARMCIEAGAKKVYAVEILADAYQKAKEIIKKLELEDKIILIHGDVTGVKLPEKVDYCVSEIVGSIGGSEGAAKIINSARNLLKDPKCMIPTRSLTKIAAVTLPESEFDCSFDETGAHYVEKVFAHIGNKFDLRLSLLSLTAKNLISNSEVFENLDFTKENLLENERDIYLEINSNSTLNGFIVWLTLYCDGEEIIDTLEKKYIWLPIYFPVFPEGETVQKGDYIKAKVIRKLSANSLNPDYTLKGKLYKEQENKTMDFIYHSPHITSEYKGNLFYKKIFAKDELKITKPISTGELREFLVQRVPDYMIPAYFVEIEKIPLTPNGKVDRKALPAPGVKIDKEHISPRNKIEEQMAELWSVVLDVKKDVIGINSNFFELGGHSLKATILTAKIHKKLNVKVPLAEIFKTPTVKGLSGYIKEAVKDRYASIEPIEKREYYAVSSAQKRLYILQRMGMENTAYNMPRFITLPAEPDVGKLEKAIIKLIKRHESLRTSFLIINEVPVQKVHDEAELKIEYYDAKLEEQNAGDNTPGAVRPASTINNFIRPFDLSRSPLLRVGLTKLADNLHLLMVDMHHIAADALSMEVLSGDFITIYDSKPLPRLRIQYKDFARWHNKEKENLEYQERYWLREFKEKIPVLNLPFDYPRPEIQDFAGHDLPFNIGKPETKVLQEIALEEGVTSFILILAFLYVMLAKISNQYDIIIGTDTAGRNHDDLERVIGMFVNTLPLRNFPAPGKTFKTFLAEVKEKTLQAFDNQSYQFEDLVEKAAVKRDASLNPIFDVMFSFKNIERKAGEDKIPESEPQTPIPNMMPDIDEIMTAKFDLTLNGTDTGDEIFLSFQYSTMLFRKETIEGFISHFKEIVLAVIKNPDCPIGEIEIISEEQNKELLKALQNEKHRKMNAIEETVHPSSSSSEAEFDF
jgi:acyl carrier protein/SAM-dependent methyltransferase